MKTEINKETKIHNILIAVFLILGLLSGASNNRIGYIVGTGFFILLFFCIYNRISVLKELKSYEYVEYTVCEGYVSKILYNSDHIGYEVVMFTDKDNSFTTGKYRALSEKGNHLGDKLLLIMPFQSSKTRKHLPKVFTKYMLEKFK